ncbi:MAG: hypothetical protein JNN03_18935 [Rubrivivax sp.]|nr:hypothetical protein [Rubrivivax sp.]
MSTLQVQIFDLWHAGSGRGGDRDLDRLVVRDDDGLPYLPGKHLKGLMRRAVVCLETWGHAKAGLAEVLFGRPEPQGQGRIDVRDAVLSAQEAAWFLQQPGAVAELFVRRANVRMNARGVAEPRGLRSIELVVPMTLHAPVVSCDHDGESWRTLKEATGLVRAVGALRHRGLGRARLSFRSPEA